VTDAASDKVGVSLVLLGSSVIPCV
jgi:hypothetical protein